jgi:hypothetical protein
MPFEHTAKPLLPRNEYYKRVFRYALFAVLLIAGSLGIGILGYHYLNDLSWIDALVNASMILTGMGPVDPLTNDAAKYFSIFSGVVFLSTVAVFLSPIVHRFLHKIHISDSGQ